MGFPAASMQISCSRPSAFCTIFHWHLLNEAWSIKPPCFNLTAGLSSTRNCRDPKISLAGATGYPEAWVKAAEKQLKGKKVESLENMTAEGVTLKPLYGPADLERCGALANPEHDAPGLFPYHRWASRFALAQISLYLTCYITRFATR